MVTSDYIEKTSGKARVSVQADLVDGEFKDISFGIMSYNGKMLGGYVSLTPYGLEHTYEGEHKEAIDKALKKVEEKISSDYNITFNEPPVMEDEPIREESEEPNQTEEE